MKRRKPNHLSRARRAYPWMRRRALAGRTITYGDLCSKLGLHHRTARWFLGVIQDWCLANGLPPLQALVINKRTRKPGDGYVATARSGATYRRALRKVFNHDWPKAVPF